jgi:hypothetical protein
LVDLTWSLYLPGAHAAVLELRDLGLV